MDPQKRSELLKQMRFQFLFEKTINCHAIVWFWAEESSKFGGLRQRRPDGRMSEAETSEQRGHHEKPTEDIVDRRLSQQDGTVPSGIPAQHQPSSDGP